jgi:tetratricopeptide (TPR) repeat protein
MADIKEGVGTPTKPSVPPARPGVKPPATPPGAGTRPPVPPVGPGAKPAVPPAGPDTKPAAVPGAKKDAPIGFGIVTPEMERYRSIIAKDPNSRVFAALSELYRKAGMLEEAIKLCLKGTTAHPNYMSGHVALSRAYLDKGMTKESKEEILKVVSITPDNIVAHKVLGEIHLLEGDVGAARENFTRALTLSPDDAEVKERLAEVERGPRPAQAKEEAPEYILEGEGLEVIEEGEGTMADLDAELMGEQLEPTTPADDLLPEGEDLDIPADTDLTLEGEGSLDEVLGDEGSVRPSEPDVFGEIREGGSGPIESEPEPEEIEGIGVEEEEDQGLVDEFGILEEGEADVSVEGLFEEEPPARSRSGARPTDVVGGARRVEEEAPPLFDLREEQPEEAGESDVKGVTITTETIADIYVKQGYYDKALSVYEELLGAFPGRESLKQKIGFVKKKIKEMGGGEGGVSAIPEEGPATEIGAAGSGEAEKLAKSIESLNRWLLNIRKYRRF